MLVSPHAAAGIAIGALISNPLVVIPVAVASHFILDTVPHWQETLAPYHPTRATYIRIPIDVVLAVSLTLFGAVALPSHALGIIIGALFATVPDIDVLVVVLPKLKRGIIKRYWDWHSAIQHETSSLWGLAPQLVVITLGLLTITRG